MKVTKKAGAIVLAFALAMPVALQTPAEAAGKAPTMTFKKTECLPDSTTTLYIEKNKTKIIATKWSSSNKKVVKVVKQKKNHAKIKTGSAGNKSATVTASVKYKVGKKVNVKKLTCKVKVVWLGIDEAGASTNDIDGHSQLNVFLNQETTNINAYDVVPEEGEILIDGQWTTNAANVAEVTEVSSEAASGTPVSVESISYSNNRSSRLWIDLGKDITEKTSYHVTLKGFKGCGSKMVLETDITVDPVKVTLTQVEYRNPENKGDIALTLSTDVPFNLDMPAFDPANNTYIKVKDDKGQELKVTDVVPSTVKDEGDQVIILLKGGADSRSFTVELNNAFMANFGDPTAVYDLTAKTIVVDKLTDQV